LPEQAFVLFLCLPGGFSRILTSFFYFKVDFASKKNCNRQFSAINPKKPFFSVWAVLFLPGLFSRKRFENTGCNAYIDAVPGKANSFLAVMRKMFLFSSKRPAIISV